MSKKIPESDIHIIDNQTNNLHITQLHEWI